MNAWNSIEAEYRDATSKLVTKKLREYTDNNKRYKLLKNHTDLLEKAGPIRMAAIISAKKMKLTDAPTIMGFKDSIFKQSYFSDVIIKYIESNNINDLDYIEEEVEEYDEKQIIKSYWQISDEFINKDDILNKIEREHWRNNPNEGVSFYMNKDKKWDKGSDYSIW